MTMRREDLIAAWDALLSERWPEARPVYDAISAHATAMGIREHQERSAAVSDGAMHPGYAWPYQRQGEVYAALAGDARLAVEAGLPEDAWGKAGVAETWLTAFKAGYESAHAQAERALVAKIRAICAAEFNGQGDDLNTDYPFFHASYKSGEDPDQALLRLFWEEKQSSPRATDDDVIMVLIYG